MNVGVGIWRWADHGVEAVEEQSAPGNVDLVGLVWSRPALAGEGVRWVEAPDDGVPATWRWAEQGPRTLLVAVVPVLTPDRLLGVLAQVHHACHARGVDAAEVHVRLVTGYVPLGVGEGLDYLQTAAPTLQVVRLAWVAVGGETVLVRSGLAVIGSDGSHGEGQDLSITVEAVTETVGSDAASPEAEVSSSGEQAPAEVDDEPSVPRTLGDDYPFLQGLGETSIRVLASRVGGALGYEASTALSRRGLSEAHELAAATPADLAEALDSPEAQAQFTAFMNHVALVMDSEDHAAGANGVPPEDGGGAPWGATQSARAVPEAGTAAESEPGSRARQLVSEWLSALSEDERDILLRHVCRHESPQAMTTGPRTQSDREQLAGLRRRLSDEVDGVHWGPVRDELKALSRRLGPWVPVHQLPLSLRDDTTRVLLDCAGYTLQRGATDRVLTMGSSALPGKQRLARLRASDALLNERSARVALETAGLRRDLFELYLQELGFSEFEGHWVDESRLLSDVDRGVLRLAIRGGPMSPSALADAIGVEDARALARDMLADLRVRQMGERGLALRLWGEGEADWITGLIKRELSQHPRGQADQEGVVTAVARQFDVKREKVAAHALAPVFVRQNGTIRVRGPREPWVFPHFTAADHSVRKGVRGVLVWRVPVNSELLRGGRRQLPMAAAKILELRPGSKLAFSGTGTLSRLTLMAGWQWSSHTGAWMERLAPVARALGAAEGEWLEISISPRRSSFTAKVDREPREECEAT